MFNNDATGYEIKPAELVTKADDIDCRFWEITLDDTPTAREQFADRPAAVVGGDLFNSLYQYTPEIKDKQSPDSYRADWIKKLMDSSSFMELHSATQGDDILAAAGAINLRTQFDKDETTRKIAHDIEQYERYQEQLRNKPAGDPKNDGTIELRDALAREIEAQLGNKETARAMRRATQTTLDDLKNAQQIAAGWNNEAGTIKDMMIDPANRIKADQVRHIMTLAGRMRQVISAQRAKRPTAGPQRVSIELGDDFGRMVPSELAMIGDPDLDDLFWRRYTERGLTLIKRDENPRLGKGPFVVCVDESGSMRGAKSDWSKAIVYAICQQAHIEKRPFGAIAFSSSTQTRETFRPDMPDMLEWLGHFYGGGTDFERPLTDAMKMVKASMPDADIIFVTDGDCDVSDAFAAQFKIDKEQNKAKVIGINVGSDENCLKKFSDSIFTLRVADGAAGLEAVIDEIK